MVRLKIIFLRWKRDTRRFAFYRVSRYFFNTRFTNARTNDLTRSRFPNDSDEILERWRPYRASMIDHNRAHPSSPRHPMITRIPFSNLISRRKLRLLVRCTLIDWFVETSCAHRRFRFTFCLGRFSAKPGIWKNARPKRSLSCRQHVHTYIHAKIRDH